MDKLWQVVVQVGEGNLVFCTDWLTNDNFVDVVKFIPVIILNKICIKIFFGENNVVFFLIYEV